MSKNIVILGPTSTGKTALALRLCNKFGGRIISVDSRQIYKYFDIGTGKVPINSNLNIKKQDKFWELDGIKVWGYDIANPKEYFSAFDFANFVAGIKDIGEGLNFFVGGTGFYFDLLLGRKNFSNVKPDLKLRESLATLTTEELFEKLKSLNPKKANSIDKNNSIRLIRALEIEESKEVSEIKPTFIIDNPSIIGLTAERDYLYRRLDMWVDEIFKYGFIDEVKALIDAGYENTSIMKGLNYNIGALLAKGDISMEEAKQRIKFDNHAFIRRQQTYFKKIQGINWVDISKDSFDSSILSLVESKLDE